MTQLTVKMLRDDYDKPENSLVYLREHQRYLCGGALFTIQHILIAAACVHSFLPDAFENVSAVVGSAPGFNGGIPHTIKDIKDNKKQQSVPAWRVAVVTVSNST